MEEALEKFLHIDEEFAFENENLAQKMLLKEVNKNGAIKLGLPE